MNNIQTTLRINTAGNGDHTLHFDPAYNKVLIGGNFGAYSVAVLEIDEDDNEYPIKDEDGNDMTALVANKTFILAGDRITLRKTGSGSVNILLTVQKLQS